MSYLLIITISCAIVHILFWIKRRMIAAAFLGAMFTLYYSVDMVNVLFSQRLMLTPTIANLPVSSDSVNTSSILVVATWWIFAGLVELSQRFFPPRKKGRYRRSNQLNFSGSAIIYILLTAGMSAIIFARVLEAGLRATLTVRQGVFSQDLSSEIAYFTLPTLVAFGLLITQKNTWVSWAVIIAGVLGLIATMSTGSRSALFLSTLIPIGLLVLRRVSLQKPTRKRRITQIIVLSLVALVPILGGTWYLIYIRGAKIVQESLLDGVDITQVDVLADIVNHAPQPLGGSTYLGGITFFIPRFIWSAKPLPGNVVTSQLLAPERYKTTGTEVTAGILGEAYLNFGMFAPIIAALLLAAMVLLCHRLLLHKSEAVWMLGVVIAIRGVNLIRSDFVNVVTPTALTVAAWALVFGLPALIKARRTRMSLLRS